MPPAPRNRVVIIGGGLAGSALASLLASSGRAVTLVEQHRAAHHKVCGEFLSTEALRYLHLLGLEVDTLGAQPVTHVRLSTGQRVSRAALPFPARSLTRRTLDQALLDRIHRAGAHLLRGDAADHLCWNASNALWQLTLRSGATLSATEVVLATGKHDLRGHLRPPGRQSQLIALKQYFALPEMEADALASHVELHLFPGGYAGLQPVEPAPEAPRGRRANLSLVLDQALYRSLGSTWSAVLAHATAHSSLLRRRLADAAALLPRPLALSRIPYGLTPAMAATPDAPGASALWRLGDQAAVIPSFTGDGMSIALHTAFCASSLLQAGATSGQLTQQLESTLRPQIGRATALSRLLVTPFAHPLASAAAPILPTLLRLLARSTRIPSSALADAHTTPVHEKIDP